jgi:agmatine deiminase
MPPEWAPHACCWIAWPCRDEGFYDIDAARNVCRRAARAIAAHEPVRLIANGDDIDDVRRRCAGRPYDPPLDFEIMSLPTNDSWTRDTAPTFLVDGRGGLAGVDWIFNSYGGLHADYEETARMAERILALTGARRFVAPIVLEGGALHTDGEGTLLTTEDVVLDERRNPGLSRDDAEEVLRAYLGVERVIWLACALESDNTGGHVDSLACFVAPGVVVALSCDDPDDPQYAGLQENLARLRAARSASERPLDIVEIRQPERRHDALDDHRISASYVNFYIANDAVILPAFDDAGDEPAHETLAQLFPQRQVVQIPAHELARVAGGFHCITQQQPLV